MDGRRVGSGRLPRRQAGGNAQHRHRVPGNQQFGVTPEIFYSLGFPQQQAPNINNAQGARSTVSYARNRFNQVPQQTWRQGNNVNQTYRPPHQRNSAPPDGNQRIRQNPADETQKDGRKWNNRKFHVGFKKLEEWSNKEPNAIIAELIGQKLGFEECLESDLTNDSVVVVLKILAKLCSSPFAANKGEIMTLASGESFIMRLRKYIMELQLQETHDHRRNMHFWINPDGFFSNLLVVFASLIETVPTRACEVLQKLIRATMLTIPILKAQQNAKISDEFEQNFGKLQEKLELCKAEVERRKTQTIQHNAFEDTPPDNFRELSVYPTSQEILSSERPFVRQHIIDGRYEDVDHYLDVQFRLLKEDFVAPLREGVTEFMHQDGGRKRGKISNVRIHPHVEFLSPHFGRDQVGVLLQFDFRPKNTGPRKSYKYSKRFMFGSLVCFVKDNFRTLMFGKILERSPELLEKGQVVVAFEPGFDNYELKQQYIMVECSVYFEPYYHVLRALQNMHEDGFPMKNYIIDVNPNMESPNYLQPDAVYKIKNFAVALSMPGSWPNQDDLALDNAQYGAFRAALTEKFVVIQGPPGTGKTFLGLQITKTLIENKGSWYNRTPILVVCFTNHALDQFLEGLIDTTTDIIRVGSQSKNKKLDPFNLREKRKSTQNKRRVNSALYSLRNELGSQLTRIKDWSEGLDEIRRFDSVVKFRHFHNVDPEFNHSWFAKASDKAIMEWLFGGRTRRDRQEEMVNARFEEIQRQERLEEDGINRAADIELDGLLEAENKAQHNIDDDEDLLAMLISGSEKPTYLTSMLDMAKYIKQIAGDMLKLGDDISEQAVFNRKWELERQLGEAHEDFTYLQMRLNEGKNLRAPRKPADHDLQQPQNMAPHDRWMLYFYWLHLYETTLINKLLRLQTEYRNKYRQYMEIKDIDDTEVMKQMLVVGMTTTGAARLQTTLQALQCRIVIVEEAAEVLESHIIVSLTDHCQHLILIGDHQQLRPSTANFRMEKHFNLGISLFERMVLNKIHCHVLGVQHRMRPEIAKLIVPNIYPQLENHVSVLNFPPVLGVDPCMYFIDHEKPEEEAGDASKLNMHEAEFLISLARYLIQNGYQPEDITILAAYSGQMFALWRERKKYDLLLHDVRVTVLDNYQGEESKIILLSLVRSNKDNRIGFLKIENRVCVALSRAKEGFYMMGNMELLCKNSEIWPKIRNSLEQQEFLGSSLALRCQIHREQVTRVQSSKDFQKVPEGGCTKLCDLELICGHRCTKLCHSFDRAHETTKCKAPCTKILCETNHVCPKMCYEECGQCQVPMKQTLPCKHEHVVPCYMDPNDYRCQTPVTANLPCGHTVTNKPCCLKAETFKCPLLCDTRVEPCGHACIRFCHIRNDPDHLEYKCFKPCAKARLGCSTGAHMCPKTCFEECPPCEIIVQKSRTICAHRFNVQCNKNVEEVNCPKPCKKELPCKHQCKKKCYEPCDNCQAIVDKVLVGCGHVVKAKCCEEPKRKNCHGRCPLLLSCGHICKKKCMEPCSTKCSVLVDHGKPVDCGHKFKIECYLRHEELPSNSYNLLKFCREPCSTKLECSHLCSGTCGECAQGRIHQSCKERCGVPLICGHECPIPCRDTCQPCTRDCSYRCKHSACKKKCGEPCTNCTENCTRQCQHIRCKAKCGMICTVPPCTEPCSKQLPCGHPCVGFCGDPCPPLCRICNQEELTEVFLGFEDEVDARFVLLEECRHVIESEGMDGWLQQGGNQINYKSCPRCKTPLSSTQRYSDYIKRALQDVMGVKKKFFGKFKENMAKQAELNLKVQTLQANNGKLCVCSKEMGKLIEDFKESLRPVRGNRRQPLNMLQAQTYTAKIQIVENISDIFSSGKLTKVTPINKAVKYVNFLLSFLLQQEQRITNQEIADFRKELKRFERIVQLCQIEDCPQLLPILASNPNVKTLCTEVNNLAFSVAPYTDNCDANLKRRLVELSKEIQAGIGITDRERREIVAAMGMESGHWFKCPNGHLYAIGDCGGANQVSKCNECGGAIGGTSHVLLSGNRHSSEMDGSRYAAYSETANNLFNFAEFRNRLL